MIVDAVAPDICCSLEIGVCSSLQTNSVQSDVNSNCNELPAADETYCVLEVYGDFDGLDESDSEDSFVEVCRAGRYSIDKRLSVRDQLGRWYVHFRISATNFTVFLRILVVYGLATDLRRDSRTVLKTARRVQTKQIRGGQYFFGVVECLVPLLNAMNNSMFDSLEDVLNIISSDGLPCFNIVNTHVGPILCCLCVNSINSIPFAIGLFTLSKRKKVGTFSRRICA